jgi:hypothetical protein
MKLAPGRPQTRPVAQTASCWRDGSYRKYWSFSRSPWGELAEGDAAAAAALAADCTGSPTGSLRSGAGPPQRRALRGTLPQHQDR